MTTTTAPANAEILAAFSDEVLTSVHYSNIGRPVRDAEGNLRYLTDAELRWIADTRAAMRARGLL